MSDNVREQLAEKRKKLEELKKRREERKRDNDRRRLSTSGPAAAVAAADGSAGEVKTGVRDASYITTSNIAQALISDVDRLVGNVRDDGAAAASGAKGFAVSSVSLADLTVTEAYDEIPPAEGEKYEIGLQIGGPEEEVVDLDEDEEERKKRITREKKRREREQEEASEALRKAREEEERSAKTLSREQKQEIERSQEFFEFFTRSTILVERALNQNDRYDVGVDYSRIEQEDDQGKSILSNAIEFFDRNRTYNRPVTAIDWNPQYKELFLASYAEKEDVMSIEPDGLVLVWSTVMPQRPEYAFYCQSAVLRALFSPSNPQLIIGGTATGQVVVWDTRQKSTPINRTSLSMGHTHPLYALAAIPSSGAVNQIMSVSTDGRLCVWSDNDLVEPSISLELKEPKNKGEVTTNSFSFPGREMNSVVLGSDEGNLYKARIYDNQPGITDVITAHNAPITQVQFHPVFKNSPREISDLYLTSSYDWTVKLWSSRANDKPLYTFESSKDYVYDVQWSPTHPAVFAMGDGTGHIDVWNLNYDTEQPLVRQDALHISSGEEEAKKVTERAVSRLKWSDDGKALAVGSSEGAVVVWDVAERISSPSTDVEFAEFYEKMRNKITDVGSTASTLVI